MTTIEELEAAKDWIDVRKFDDNSQRMTEILDTIRETLTQAIAIKKGDMVVVPKEPDEKMICAAFEQCDGYNAKYYRDLYKAMIAAQEERG